MGLVATSPTSHLQKSTNSLIGNFIDNKLEDQGKIVREGTVYVGELKNELEDGKGMLYPAKGGEEKEDKKYGIFKQGKLVEEIVYDE